MSLSNLPPGCSNRDIENDADGVWLISHGGLPHDDLLRLAERTNRALWCGVNLLGVDPMDAVHAAAERFNVRGLWMDHVGVNVADAARSHRVLANLVRLRSAVWEGLVFGGVAFKYVKPGVPRESFGTAALMAAQGGIDVVTTSGSATGVAPDVDKLILMRMAIGDHALAVASGITPENVGAFLPHVDAYLVATGIEARDGVFDPARVKSLADAVHAGSSA
jgi:predicted TIM-barrel enzyme